MVKRAFIDENGLIKGAWSTEEDNILIAHVQKHGHKNWRMLPKHAGLARCGKSCRLRWVNYLKPGVRRGNFTEDEVSLIIQLHQQFGTKWSMIAARLPERTDNDIKNFWHAHIKKHMINRASTEHISHELSTENTNGTSRNIATQDEHSYAGLSSGDSGSFSGDHTEITNGITSDHASSLVSFPEIQPSFWNHPFPADRMPAGRSENVDPQSVLMQQSYWNAPVGFYANDSFQGGAGDLLQFEDEGFSYPGLWDMDQNMSLLETCFRS